jgi:antigen flippase
MAASVACDCCPCGSRRPVALVTRSYSSILKASAITASYAAVTMVIGLVSTKALSIILGPAGLGELRMFQNLLGFVGFVVGFGMGNSAIRSIAAAHKEADEAEVARLTWLLRRISIVYSILGALVLAALAAPVSRWVFDSGDRAGQIAILGGAVIFMALQSGHVLPLQARRQVGLVGRISVVASAVTAVVTIGVMSWRGIDGVVLALTLSAAGGFLAARSLDSLGAAMPAFQRRTSRRELLDWGRLGISSMAVDAMLQLITLVSGSIVVHELGMETLGQFGAAYGLSGIFVTFVVSAMGSDFFPRLSAVREDPREMTSLVNQQAEIGVLIAIPGLLVTLCFAPLAVRVFYSSEFAPAAELLRWYVLAGLARVLATPLSFVFPAVGSGAWMVASHVSSQVAALALAVLGLRLAGASGWAAAAVVSGFLQVSLFGLVARRLIGYAPSGSMLRLAGIGAALLAVGMAVQLSVTDPVPNALLGALVVAVGALISARGLIARLGHDHRFVRWMAVLPVVPRLVGMRRPGAQ